MGETAITLQTLVTNAGQIISAAGTNFTSLSNAFGFALFIPITLAMTKAVVGIIKSLLFFKRGRGRR